MKVLRLDDGADSYLEIEPQSLDKKSQLILSVQENDIYSSIYVDKSEAEEIIDYLKEHFTL